MTEHLVDVAGDVEEEDNDMVISLFIINISLFIININILIKITIMIIVAIDTMTVLDSHGGKPRFDLLSTLIAVPHCLQLSTGSDISTTRSYPGPWACSIVYLQNIYKTTKIESTFKCFYCSLICLVFLNLNPLHKVYECPGLAPHGEMVVTNPFFMRYQHKI